MDHPYWDSKLGLLSTVNLFLGRGLFTSNKVYSTTERQHNTNIYKTNRLTNSSIPACQFIELLRQLKIWVSKHYPVTSISDLSTYIGPWVSLL